MTARRRTTTARPDLPIAPAPTAAGTYTGVAGGSLGTAANLEDTQVYQLEDLQAPEPEMGREFAIARESPVAPELAIAPEPDVVPAAAPVARTPRGQRPTPSPVVFDEPVSAVRPVRSRPIAGGAIAAAVLVAVIGGGALLALAGDERDDGAGTGAGAPTAGATVAPATAAPNDGGGGGDGGNNGKGNGNGNGNGKGNGNGNGKGN